MVGTLTQPFFDERSNGIIRFLLLSLALHATVLYFVRSIDIDTPASPTPSLSVTLSPLQFVPASEPPTRTDPAQKSAVVVRHAEPSAVMSVPASPASEATIAPATATIDLDVARATARAYAREPVPRTTLDAPKPLLTVEAAVARSTEPDFVIETRGPAGERIVTTRNMRCVTPLVVPHFMEGVTVLALCEKRKK